MDPGVAGDVAMHPANWGVAEVHCDSQPIALDFELQLKMQFLGRVAGRNALDLRQAEEFDGKTA
jgi:hypothetical protein